MSIEGKLAIGAIALGGILFLIMKKTDEPKKVTL